MEVITTIISILFPVLLYVVFPDKFHPKHVPYLYYFIVSLSDSPCECDQPPIIEKRLNETELQPRVDIKHVTINRDEVTLVMERINQTTTKEGEQIEDCMGYEEFSALFQESEPSLTEVKEAFSVFDQNRDGLIDARDLQRVLDNLGLVEGTNLDACKRMIEQHDRNGDGHVDLIDFSRLLEMSLLEKGE